MIKTGIFEYEDVDELLNSFKQTLKPKANNKKSNFNDFTVNDVREYTEILQWLKKNGYFIVQFPNTIQKQSNIKDFAYYEIRDFIRKNKGYKSDDKIPWSDRRELIEKMVIKKRTNKEFEIDEDLNQTINKIANNRGGLDNQTIDDKLGTLNNCIEYLLKKEGKFIEVPNELFYGFVGNKDIKKFREDTQIFRHTTDRTFKERELWSENKKLFYIRLGIMLVIEIYNMYND